MRPIVLGAYWTVTRRCLHRVRSCDHRVRSSRKKRILPFLTVRSDLAFLFLLDPKPFRALPPHRAATPPSSHRIHTVPSLPRPQPRHPRLRRASAPAKHAARSPVPLCHRSRPAPPPSVSPPPSSVPPEQPHTPPRPNPPLPRLQTARAPPLRGPRPLSRNPNPSFALHEVFFHLRELLRLRKVTSLPWIRVCR
jgi:hypothetical protein